MNAKLLVIDGNKVKREVLLRLPAVLGRSRAADITVGHALISRRHCELSEVNGLLMLHDLASLNGTTIGDRRIELAALLPDGEFNIGPLTFRVLYEFNGSLDAIPDTRFAEEAGEVVEAVLADPAGEDDEDIPDAEADEALPAAPLAVSLSDEFSMPDLMALADVQVEEIVPVAVPKPPLRDKPAGSRRPSLADDKETRVPLAEILGEPLDVDSSLQSGGYRVQSPWAKAPPATKPPEATSAEKVAKPAAKEKPKAASPPQKPNPGKLSDSGFGNFLAGLE